MVFIHIRLKGSKVKKVNIKNFDSRANMCKVIQIIQTNNNDNWLSNSKSIALNAKNLCIKKRKRILIYGSGESMNIYEIYLLRIES